MRHLLLASLPIAFVSICLGALTASATDILQIDEHNYGTIVPKGKEVDAIYGDWVFRNDKIVCVIANPNAGRNANMTVRGVGGMLIDMTRRGRQSDQLSCFYPAGGRYKFTKPDSLVWRVTDERSVTLSEVKRASSKTITLQVRGTSAVGNGTVATVSYSLTDGQDWLDYRVTISNESAVDVKVPREDQLRCDGNLFRTGVKNAPDFFYAEDIYFGQCYGFLHEDGVIRREGGRSMKLISSNDKLPAIEPNGEQTWHGKVFCSQSLPGVAAQVEASTSDARTHNYLLVLKDPMGPVAHSKISISSGSTVVGDAQAGEDGTWNSELLPGKYTATIEAFGHPTRTHEIDIGDSARADTLSYDAASRVRASVKDSLGSAIPCKVQFVGQGETPSPDFGPDSAIFAMKNVVYTTSGKFEQRMAPGTYQVIVSHGPEYDAHMEVIQVSEGQLTQLTVELPRTVDTTGWISTEYHSHSSPSGDNVSHQTGRVVNLLAEQIDFAPCTEHNRIDTYEDDLAMLGMTSQMATCTGMELTGSLLPVNHQNAFPLEMHIHQQDGGGPVTDSDPVKQIERLALWDNSAPKLVQTNHPNIPQILGDRNVDGEPDDGFRGMLGWMDCMEIHPPQGIFSVPDVGLAREESRKNPTFHWLQLLNLGYRIPGVVNTDAHYNFHGSGWLRNYVLSSTDAPSQINIAEVVEATERGNLTMTTGPFLQAELRRSEGDKLVRYHVGDGVDMKEGPVQLWIRVQCPNWFDINRVQVFANGRPLEQLNFTRKTTPKHFSDKNVRFETTVVVPTFEEDTHLIVATIGEGLKLGPVMGEQQGNRPPVAISNPFFLDVDGSGFQPNGDDLGIPFALPEIASE